MKCIGASDIKCKRISSTFCEKKILLSIVRREFFFPKMLILAFFQANNTTFSNRNCTFFPNFTALQNYVFLFLHHFSFKDVVFCMILFQQDFTEIEISFLKVLDRIH